MQTQQVGGIHRQSNPDTQGSRIWSEPSACDEASRGLAERSEAQIVRWVQFPAGALFFVLDPGGSEGPGQFTCLTEGRECSTSVDFNDQNWGGYSVAEYEVLERTHRISQLAQRPWLLNQEARIGEERTDQHR